MRALVIALPIAFILSGCVSDQPPSVWVRTDGQRVAGDLKLQQKSDIDKTICRGEAQKAGLAGQQQMYGTLTTQLIAANAKGQAMDDVAAGCMAQRGYVLVPESEAQHRLDAFAAAATQTKTASR